MGPAPSPRTERTSPPDGAPPRSTRQGTALPGASHTPRGATPSGSDFIMGILTGGNLLVRIGVIVLFVGVAFLVKYASDLGLFPIEGRLIGAALGAVALLAIGWRLRNKREVYALTLQGGGIGIIYLVVFAAFRLYELLPAWFAFPVLVLLCALSALLAVLQNSRSLAVFGAVGGFLAPLLISTDRGSHVALFSYYAVLDAGILAIAWFKSWRILNLTGFIFTFSIGALWGYGTYRPENFATTEPFLILFFLFFTAIAVLFATRQPVQLKGYVDGTIVFGTPIITFMEQTVLVRSYEYGAAWSAVVMGAFYLSLAWSIHRKQLRELDLLAEAFLAIAAGFAILAIPLSFDYKGVASAWAIEGAALVWVGVRQRRLPARVTGLLLQAGAGVALIPYIIDLKPMGERLPVLNGFYLGCVLIAFAGLFSAFYLAKSEKLLKKWEQDLPPLVGTWALLWWFGGGLHEIDRCVGPGFRSGAIACFLSASCMACCTLRKRLDWPFLRYPALGLLPAMVLFALRAPHSHHPFGEMGYVGWPVAFAALYRILYESEDTKAKVLEYLHAGTLWLLALVLAWEAHWQAAHRISRTGIWDSLAAGLCLSGLALLICIHGRRLSWPIGIHQEFYMRTGLGPIVVTSWLWAVCLSLTSSGDPHPLPFVPLLNPLDVTVGFAFLTLLVWLSKLRSQAVALPHRFMENLPAVRNAIGLTIFLWLNSILVRCTHYWGGIPFYFDALSRSVLVQACLSIFWSLSAFCLMLFAARKRLRPLWFAGAGLLAIVVVKLFLVDLSQRGTVERIISFVGVGILILAVGYLSPVPPQSKGAEIEK